ncbi:iron-sulfur cluster assembly accessory protein [Buchnera aphidicola]|uniref:iron-sulfur cluster assembly accessory protein n=1 Tax=Buchnera aphidicola TaxID=9 RepID=UPI002238F78D|nr:iron-sulfur cluster assembly accessory protein [Buchnera aphidicola]MCW5197624.1 iron-sulfur cluster assembly accessory protein [Buchnera aphidicola (Chaitophorus viminalis)]
MKKYLLKSNEKKLKGIFVTQNALKKIIKIYNIKKNIIGIKIDIKKTGCAGYKYILKYITKNTNTDFIFVKDNISIFLPKNKIHILDGITINFIKNKFNNYFDFYHKNSQNKCGCGESFQINL